MRFISLLCVLTFSLLANVQATAPLKNALQSFPKATPTLKKFYQNRQYRPLWFVGSSPSVAFENAENALKKAHLEGLSPDDYAPFIAQAKNEGESAETRELYMSKAVLLYLRDLTHGRLRNKPKKHWQSHGILKTKRKTPPSKILHTGMRTDPTAEWLLTFTNHDRIYQEFKNELARQHQLEETSPWPDHKITKTLSKGMTDPEVGTLRKLLYLHGISQMDLPQTEKENTYDAKVVSSIYIFQEKMGLKQDGFVGKRTREILNMSPQERIKKLRIAMERWRWLPEELGPRHIMVNIPWFELQLVDNYHIKSRIPIIIGKSYRKTPVFSTYVRGVRFNPTWHVPRSIALRKLKLFQKDPSYVTKNNFRVLKGNGESVSPQSINWSNVTRNTFNYKLRQTPGDHNALGRIRLLMHNPFRVFLHGTDTKSQKLFDQMNRSFSSGCIRMSDPTEVAEFVFDDQGKWDRSAIENVIHSGKTRNEKTSNRVPVHVVYFTSWPRPDGTVQFKPDLYGMDDSVWNALTH